MQWHFTGDMPIYAQLVYQIRLGIVSGELKPGDKISGVRELAAEAGVNPNTMQRALQELERDGLVFTQRNSGRFVTEDIARIEQAKRTLAAGYVERFTQSMAKLGYTAEEIIKLLTSGGEET